MRDRPKGCIEMSPQVSATRSSFEELIDRLSDHRRFRRPLGSCTSLQTAGLIIIEVYLGPLHGVYQYTSYDRGPSLRGPIRAEAAGANLRGEDPFLLVAEADGNRTRPPGMSRRTGFEDREGHQSPFASSGDAS